MVMTSMAQEEDVKFGGCSIVYLNLVMFWASFLLSVKAIVAMSLAELI
jgi:hypothetical protein